MTISSTGNPYKDGFLLSIVVPVYNEHATIAEVIDTLVQVPYRKQIIIVDDGSSDGTTDILRKAEHEDLKLVFHEKNLGKGAAIRTGFKSADGDIILIQDADLEYDPGEYPILLQPILRGSADVVYGSRFAGHGAHRVLYFWHYVGNRFLTFLSNMLTNLNLTDMETCYKVFTSKALEGIELKEDRFGFEPEITAKVARKKLRIYEVPISYYGRTYEEGKKINWKDGVRTLWCILKYNIGG
ncbi:MAG: glycosyltransferase family 2 protein [Deltaproteobacteria bacterium]|nr:glycosyltransferase family 2 protein [Deltaproteobacteria bacterium]MBW1819035.1 glycosyltransferase family 2 protein [Deltaproteobacteria bacterium]